ncbi:uncharacterized protein LOC128022011 isoform X2 [Carassius gibelio]|uniref:uncharacterized protein LOC128022011 isoform X2 n=1 Tax=Carassius gibelio TaxID=101364 RepID=UPI00227899A3|nr:uncharacterized protein LOC128022011 isoform X2 [Carassius gibelio]
MSKKLQLSRRGQNENDEDSDIATIKHFHHEEDENDEESSTKQTQNRDINEVAEATVKKPKAQDTTSEIDTTDTLDRPLNSTADDSYYVKNEAYFSDFTNFRLFAEVAQAGRARAEDSIFEAETKGSSISFDTEVSPVGAKVMARAEVASASASVGPVGVKVGLGFDTGASVGEDGVEAKFLGTGFSIGQKNSISVLGSEASCSVM